MSTKTQRTLVPAALLVAAAATCLAVIGPDPAGEVGAARRWLASLDEELRGRAQMPFDAEARRQWSYLPGRRSGVRLDEMDLEQRRAAHALLRSVLSSRGYLKTTAVMGLERVLRRAAEARGRRAPHRNQGHYTFAVFGEPSDEAPWGWRVEGHHVSLNFSSVGGVVVSATPAFLGANPAEVRSGPEAGLRVLAAEEDLARRLLGSLTEKQLQRALIADRAPRDIVLGPGRNARLEEKEGLPASAMTAEQKAVLWRLIGTYARNLRHDLADRELERIRKASLGEVRFAWAGSRARGKPHYYRLHGPTFVVEYDNVQNGANHAHTVWRDPDNDFAAETLKRHHERHHR